MVRLSWVRFPDAHDAPHNAEHSREDLVMSQSISTESVSVTVDCGHAACVDGVNGRVRIPCGRGLAPLPREAKSQTVSVMVGRGSESDAEHTVSGAVSEDAAESAPSVTYGVRNAETTIRVDSLAGRVDVIGAWTSDVDNAADITRETYALLTGIVRKHIRGGGTEYVRAGVVAHGMAQPQADSVADAVSEAVVIYLSWRALGMSDSLAERLSVILETEGADAAERAMTGAAGRDGVRKVTHAHTATTAQRRAAEHKDAGASYAAVSQSVPAMARLSRESDTLAPAIVPASWLRVRSDLSTVPASWLRVRSDSLGIAPVMADHVSRSGRVIGRTPSASYVARDAGNAGGYVASGRIGRTVMDYALETVGARMTRDRVRSDVSTIPAPAAPALRAWFGSVSGTVGRGSWETVSATSRALGNGSHAAGIARTVAMLRAEYAAFTGADSDSAADMRAADVFTSDHAATLTLTLEGARV